jgi:polyisoprenoid-binding protein YceI
LFDADHKVRGAGCHIRRRRQQPFTGKGVIAGFNAQGMVKRSDFGLGKYVPIVSDETTITISAEFIKR